MKRTMIATVLMLAASSGVWGQATPTPTQPASPPGQLGMGGMPMMMNMMNMMTGMPMMGMMGLGMSGIATIDRIEGRIAFLRTELKITETQTSAWNALADALRANAKKLGEVRTSMMTQFAARQQAATLADRLELQEQWLRARLEGTQAIKTTFTSLYGILSEDQKNTANEILAPHMGMMAMMSGQMQPGSMMPGPMMRQQGPQPGK
jgi:hypothetical protein